MLKGELFESVDKRGRFRGSKIRDWKIQLSFFRASKTKFFLRGGEKERDEQLAIFTTSVEC